MEKILKVIDNLNLSLKRNDKYFVTIYLKYGETIKLGSNTELNTKKEILEALRQKV